MPKEEVLLAKIAEIAGYQDVKEFEATLSPAQRKAVLALDISTLLDTFSPAELQLIAAMKETRHA